MGDCVCRMLVQSSEESKTDMKNRRLKLRNAILPLLGLLIMPVVASAHDEHQAVHNDLNAEHSAGHEDLNAEHDAAHQRHMSRRQHRRLHRRLKQEHRDQHQDLNDQHQDFHN